MMFDLDVLVRENIKNLSPYSSARSEYRGEAVALLDANESGFGSPLPQPFYRYPDPYQLKVREKIAELNSLQPGQIFLGNGSDEAIDLLFRIFCRPGIDNVILCPPTYGMYEVAARINDVAVLTAPLTNDFQLDAPAIAEQITAETKLIFVCSPNNPTGNLLERDVIIQLAESFKGIVVVDEAYIHFANEPSLTSEIERLHNLVVLQTFSKAWGLAGLRVGVAFANLEIIRLFDRVKPPYNIGQNAQELLLTALQDSGHIPRTTRKVKRERDSLQTFLGSCSFVRKIFPSDANFLLVQVQDADGLYRFLLDRRIVVRNRSGLRGCEQCLRISIGSPAENEALKEALKQYEESLIH